MSTKTFKGGIHPRYFKELTSEKPIQCIDAPNEVAIPLSQHSGAACVPVVKPGDTVKIGTLIGNSEKLISAPVHSSVSGTVKLIKKVPHPTLGACDCVIINSDGKDDKAYPLPIHDKGLESLNAGEIKSAVKEAGIVGLGGAAFPTYVKLSPPDKKPIDTFILNGAECEPYLTCDERVMVERSKHVVIGALLIMKALGVNNGLIAIEDNKPHAIDAISAAVMELRVKDLRVVVLNTKYPQGGEKPLIKAVMKREVPSGGLPFDVGCMVDNVQTALAIYEAVYQGKPLYERVITVTGDAIKEPSNLLVRIGTPISYIIEKCGGFSKKAGKIIIGGPMMGMAQYTIDAVVIKGTSGILALSLEAAKIKISDYCIRCARCIRACPVNLMPTEIAKAAEYGHFDLANMLNAPDCMECGCCAYVCPSNIPLVQLIKHAKRSIVCQI